MLEEITEKRKKIILVFLFALAAFLITFHFTDTPNVWVDEGVFTNVAETLAHHRILAMQITPGSYYELGYFLSTNYPVIFPVAASLALFGNGIWQARLSMIIYMFLLVLVFYLFAEKAYQKKYNIYPAILSVLMLLSFSPFYGNGRSVIGEVPGLFFLVLGCLLLLYLEQSDFISIKYAFFSGLAFGLAASTKTIYLGLLSISIIGAVFLWRKKIQNKKILFVLAISFLLPIIFWFFINYSPEISPLATLRVIFNLASNSQAHLSIFQVILRNSLRFATESTPILFIFLLIVISASFVFRYFKKDTIRLSMSELVLFFFILLNFMAYLPGTGWYRYFFPAHVLLYLLFPSSFFVLAKSIHSDVYRKIIFCIPVMLIVFQFYHLVFLSDTSLISDRSRNDGLSSEIGNISSSKKVLFYNTVESIVFFKGVNYSQYSTMENFYTVGDKNILATSALNFDYILIGNTEVFNPSFLSCFDKKLTGRVSLYQKKSDCNTK